MTRARLRYLNLQRACSVVRKVRLAATFFACTLGLSVHVSAQVPAAAPAGGDADKPPADKPPTAKVPADKPPATKPAADKPPIDTWGTDDSAAPTTTSAPDARVAAETAGNPAGLPADCPCAPLGEGNVRETAPPVRYTLEGIQVRGNTRTRDRVVLRYVPFKPGDVFDVDDPEVELSRYRLLGTGFFRDVQFSLRKGSARGFVVLV